jgi:23S rRNA (pseudouridine1915-N3)-methyltransferase
MKIRIVALGSRMPAWVGAACADYLKRMPRDYALELVELKPEPRREREPVDRILAAEASRIARANRGYRVIALDERGSRWTTAELSAKLGRHRDAGDALAFVIGSADGLADTVKRDAAAVLSLSALTLPHALARVVLLEQLYRAASMLAGHPYHRE